MVKTYLSYTLKNTLGQITNSKSFALSKDFKLIFVSFNDYVMGFDLKTGQEILKFKDQNIKITYLLTLSNTLVIGYDNGSLYILDISNLKNIIISKEKRTFIHQKGISCINHNNNETRLIIGSVDKLISVVDIVSNLIVYKLSGHKEKVNNAKFYDDNEQFIFSISDDFSFKIWDTNIQKCIYTYSDTANKLTSFININSTILFGTFSKEINIFYFNPDSYLNSDIETKLNNKNKNEILINKGVIKKQSNNKTISFCSNNEVFIVLSNDPSIELFKILSKKELKARLIKYYMNVKKMNYLDAQTNMSKDYKEKKYDFKFKFKSIFKFQENNKKNSSASKIFSAFLLDNNKLGYITNKNSIEIYKYSSNFLTEKIFINNIDNKKIEVLEEDKEELSVKKIYSIGQNLGGHQSQIYLIKYSPNNQEFYSVSNEEIKLWGGKNLDKALKSQSIISITSITFEEDKDILIASNKKGNIYLLNMNSLEIVKTFEKIHSGSINVIIALPYKEEKHILVTCSNDKTIKFWNLEFNDDKNNDINLDFENEMNVLDSVNYALVTQDLKFFSYALLDNTIKIYYFDTMKIHLNLYGHKMPVTHYDISSDGLLLVSGSLDKSVKIWGMDFGDCHKTLPAHTDVVTCVKFIKNTHFFITSSKDCNMKYYDADTFDFILLLTNNLLCNQFLCIDINSEGTQIVSSSNDGSIKIFQISDEQALPKITQQELLEQNMIKEQEKEFNNMNNNMYNKNDIDDNATQQLAKKMDHLTYAENLIEKLNLCEQFKESVIQYHMEIDEFIKNMKIVSDDQNKLKDVKIYNLNISMEKPKPSLFFFGKNIFEVILQEIKNIPYFDLENVLNNISYSYFQKLVYYFEHYIRKNIEVELIGRCIIFFANKYEDQISNDKVILNYLRSIYQRLQGRFKLKYSLIKFNSKSIELIIKKFQDIQKNKNLMNEEIKNNNIIDLKE